MKIFHLCEHCNKEFELHPDLNYYVAIETCPHCHKQNDIWIKIVK